ncbi:MAG: ATP-binding protein [Kofleriaceae bacterium]
MLAAELDHEFRLLLYTVTPRSELGVLAALLPRLEDRLAMLDAIGPDSPVVQRGLLRRTEEAGLGVLSATRRFRATVSGRPLLSMLPSFAERVEGMQVDVPWVSPPPGLLTAMRGATRGVMCIVGGRPGVGKTSWARHAACTLGGEALHIDAAQAARSGLDISVEIRELIEDAALVGAAVVLDNAGELLEADTWLSSALEAVLDTTSARVFVVVDEASQLHERIASRALGHVTIGPPGPAARRDLWRSALAAPRGRDILAEDLVLSPRQIANALALVEAGAAPRDAVFGQLAKMHDVTLPDLTTAGLDSLSLPEATERDVVELISAILARSLKRSPLAAGRGRTLSAIFNGDSGTDASYACDVIAAEVGLPLWRVPVASLLSGTEGNLECAFARARAQGGILLLDEADALFGSPETTSIFRLVEGFAGILFLTTRLAQHFDPALTSQILFKIHFDPPQPSERERIWRSAVPGADFADDVDLARLASTFELSGGSIRAAALRAAYRAAWADTQITMADLVECAERVATR